MPNDPLNIRIEPRAPVASPRRKSRRPATWIILASAGCMLLAAVALFATSGSLFSPGATNDKPESPASKSPAVPANSTAIDPVPAAASREQIVDDPQGELLWASPTAGEPLSLAYVPAGTQCLIHLRPALLASHPEGERVLAALGPWGQSVVKQLETMTNAEFADIQSLLIAVVVNADGELDACLRVEFNPPPSKRGATEGIPNDLDTATFDYDEMAPRFPMADPVEVGENGNYLAVGDRAMITARPSTLVVCPASFAGDLIDSAGEAPPLVRDIEILAENSDADRAFTVIVAPKFLEASGNELLVAEAAALHDALHWLIGADATAIAISAHWEGDFFAEFRATPALNVAPRRLAAKLRERIAAAPDVVEETILASPWHPYGRKILARFPAMLRALARYSRAGEDDRQALVRVYLPPIAGHNLLMAAELLLTQPHDEATAAIGRATPKSPLTLEERLAKITSLTFSKDSLERALEMLAEDAGLEIILQGADLQLDGITKNQSLALDLRDHPAGEILVEILVRANPDRTATGPTDARQKLVYVIEPSPAGGAGRIIVTTRAAAEKRNERLPDAFLLKDR